MLFAAALFAALASALAIPVPERDVTSVTTSTGVQFKVNVLSGPADLASIDGLYLTGIHVGAGINIAGFTGKDQAMTFYLNGTGSDALLINSWPPYGFNFDSLGLANAAPDGSIVMISGATTPDADVKIEGSATPLLQPGSWAACSEPVAYYANKTFTVLEKFASDTQIPETCAPVEILPYCATLPEFPASVKDMNLTLIPEEITCYTDSS